MAEKIWQWDILLNQSENKRTVWYRKPWELFFSSDKGSLPHVCVENINQHGGLRQEIWKLLFKKARRKKRNCFGLDSCFHVSFFSLLAWSQGPWFNVWKPIYRTLGVWWISVTLRMCLQGWAPPPRDMALVWAAYHGHIKVSITPQLLRYIPGPCTCLFFMKLFFRVYK